MEKLVAPLLKKIILKFGYKINKIRISENSFKDPRELNYSFALPYNETKLPLKLAVGLNFYSIRKKSFHPYIVALRCYDKTNDIESIKKILTSYAKLVSYSNGNEAIGLENGPFVETDFKHYTYPWSTISPEERKVLHDDINRGENLKYDFDSPECLEILGLPFRK